MPNNRYIQLFYLYSGIERKRGCEYALYDNNASIGRDGTAGLSMLCQLWMDLWIIMALAEFAVT